MGADSLRNNLLDLKDNEILPHRKTIMPKSKGSIGVIKNEVIYIYMIYVYMYIKPLYTTVNIYTQ